MRYVLALTLALAIGIASIVPAAQASDREDPATYRDGQIVLRSAVPVTLEPSSASSVVAGAAPGQSAPYMEQHYENQGH